MEGGFVAERNNSLSLPLLWVAGAVRWSLFGGVKLRGRRQLYIATMRCTDCGFLELYAPSK